MPEHARIGPTGDDFRLLFESAPGLFLVLQPRAPFAIVAASDAYLAATMTKRADIIGRPLFEVFPDNPADPNATGVSNLRASLERATASRRPDVMPVQRYDVRRQPESAGAFEERYWRPLNTPLFGPDGQFRFILHRVEDVTELVRARQDVASQQLLTNQVKEYAIFMLDPRGRVTTWNAGAQRLKGYEAEEILGKHFSVFYTPEDVASGKPERLLERALSEGQAEDEGWRVTKDGTRFWGDVVITPVLDAAGGVMGFAKVTRDLTEKKERIDLLRRWEHLFEHAQWGIAILDATVETLSLMNGAFARMHGYTVDELHGRPLSQLIAHGYEQQSKSHLAAVVAKKHHNFEVMHRRKDGSQFPVLVDATAVQAGTGTLLYEAVQVQDITERKRREDEQAFLAKIGLALGSSLDHDAMLARVATLAVPHLADACIFDLVEDESSLRRVAVAHADPAARTLKWDAATADRPPVWRRLENGESVVRNTAGDEDVAMLARTADELAALSEMRVSRSSRYRS